MTKRVIRQSDRRIALFRQLLNAPVTVWLLLALPACVWMYGYYHETLFYGELLHATGDLAARLLIVTMAITPVGLMFPGRAFVLWLKARRRHFGVAAFAYALLHTLIYIDNRPDLAVILEQAGEVGMWTGWLALLVMLVLAATSNDTSVRLMKRGWKTLHRFVYAAAILTFLHWILTAYDPLAGAVHLGILVALEIWRMKKTFVRWR